ncbi:MAG: hypothetical protein HY720_26665 [Planctomycetes bacterium]|nr:hypothetical protein [Planctomycetota bacterium]
MKTDHASKRTAVLGRVRRRRRAVRVLSGTALATFFILSGALAAFALDNLLALPGPLRIALAALVAGGTVWFISRRILPAALGRFSDEAAALEVERARPDLDNRLINSVLLDRESLGGEGREVASLIREDAVAMLSSLKPGQIVPFSALRRPILAFAVAAAALAIYAAAFPEALDNAIDRYADPLGDVPALSGTRIEVEPGDVTVARGEPVSIRVLVSGEPVESVLVRTQGTGNEEDHPMRFTGNAFVFTFDEVLERFSYTVYAGDARSHHFWVTVLPRPRIEDLEITYLDPPYLGRPERVERHATGDIAALAGTVVRLRGTASSDLVSARIHFESGPGSTLKRISERVWETSFTVRTDDSYEFELEDAAGIESARGAKRTVTCLEDLPPSVEILEPAGRLSLSPEEAFPVSIRAADDVALASVTFLAEREGAPEDRPMMLAEWAIPGGPAEWTVAKEIDLAALSLASGTSLSCVAEAVDMKGNRTRSAGVRVSLVPARLADRTALRKLADILDGLRHLIELQEKALAGLASCTGDLAEIENRAEEQESVRLETLKLLDLWSDPRLAPMTSRTRLSNLAREEMVEATDVLVGLLSGASGEEVSNGLSRAKGLDEKILRVLREIAGEVAGTRRTARDEGLEPALAGSPESKDEDAARKILEDLKRFAEEQKKAIEASENLAGKDPDDFSPEELAAIEELAEEEGKWAKFFQEAVKDLSKLYPQDFSNSSLAKEFVEAYGQVELAADALEKKNVEIAVPAEQAGLELAEEITSNLERWLSDEPDIKKWEMEDPTTDLDVPMADLPEELEDLAGDLLDQEEEMAEDTEDVTSAWMDSLDKGAGWTAADGPISNMSAKGITGNLQPNTNEVGGRSGEGRSGKSSGQMVEEEATGKGGRQTPTRNTNDPYEAGQVKDESTDASGGSTGGGKVGSVGQEGLRGTPPPEIEEAMKRIAESQAQVRNSAEKLKLSLARRSYSVEDLEEAIRRMKEMEEDLRLFRGADYEERRKEIVRELEATREVVAGLVRQSRDPSAGLPPALRDELRSAQDEEAPEAYRELLKEYFRSLSEERR